MVHGDLLVPESDFMTDQSDSLTTNTKTRVVTPSLFIGDPVQIATPVASVHEAIGVIKGLGIAVLFEHDGADAMAVEIMTYFGTPPDLMLRFLNWSRGLHEGDVGARTAMPTSWRPYTHTHFWLEHDAVISSEGGGGGRRAYEVWVHGESFATRPSLAEAKRAVEERYGPLIWTTQRSEPFEVDHPLGATTEFTSPTTYWATDLPKMALSKTDPRGTTCDRGYDYDHECERAKWEPKVKAGGVKCSRCGDEIGPQAKWDLDHRSDRSHPSHAKCNREAGGKSTGAFKEAAKPRVEEQGPSPLDYPRSGSVERLGLVDENATSHDSMEYPQAYFAPTNTRDYFGPSGRRLKNPRLIPVPGAEDGTIGFLDYHTEPDGVYIDYICMRQDYRGKGLSRVLVDALYKKFHNVKLINWGKVMNPHLEGMVNRYLEHNDEPGQPKTLWRRDF